jgi:hypothetical protein
MARIKDEEWVMLIIILASFSLGYIVASAILDKREVTKEDMIELNKPQYYE